MRCFSRLRLTRFVAALSTLVVMLLPVSALAAPNASVIFFIDTSGSMRGERISTVVTTIDTVTKSLDPAIQVGLYAFSDLVTEIQQPTNDRAILARNLAKLSANGGTSLYDALVRADSVIKRFNPTRVVLLSDGKDTDSKQTFTQVKRLFREINTPVDIIGIDAEPNSVNEFVLLTSLTGGKFYSIAELDELIGVYSSILGLIPATPTQPLAPYEIQIQTNTAVEVWLAVAAAILITWLASILTLVRSRRKRLKKSEELLSAYESAEAKRQRRANGLLGLKRFLIPDRIEKWIKGQLEDTHTSITFETVVKILISLVSILFLVFWLFFGSVLMGLVMAPITTLLLFKLMMGRIQSKQRKEFEEELPELLNVVASGLNAGLGLQQSLESYAIRSDTEVSIQLKRVLAEVRLGTPLDEALGSLANRMGSENLTWVVTALSIQKLIGGSMAAILTSSYETIRSRSEIKREVRTLSAEGRMSANVLIGLPIVIFLFLFLTRREYLETLWTTAMGLLLFLGVIANLIIGTIWMRKIVQIKL